MVSHEFPPLETDGGMLKEEEHRNAMVAHAQEAAEAARARCSRVVSAAATRARAPG